MAGDVRAARDDEFADRLAAADLVASHFAADERGVADFVVGMRGLVDRTATDGVGQHAAELAAMVREAGGAGEAGQDVGQAPVLPTTRGVAASPRRRFTRRLAWSLAAAVVVLSGTAGLALAGELPTPLQDLASGVANRLGLDVPDSAEAALILTVKQDLLNGAPAAASIESSGVAVQAHARNEMTREIAVALAGDNGNGKSQGIGLAIGVIKNADKTNASSNSAGSDPTVPGKSEDSSGKSDPKAATGSVKVVNPNANDNASKPKK